MEEEIWKDIKDYEGLYQISNLGRVKALEKKCWNGKVWWNMPESILKHTITNYGYAIVGLYKLDRKKGKNFLVHRILADHFIPNPENKPHINHINHNRIDNIISNLEWITQRENCSHSKLRSGNKTGFANVKKHHKRTTYCFYLHLNGKDTYKGSFKTPKEAHEGYLQFLKDNNRLIPSKHLGIILVLFTFTL